MAMRARDEGLRADPDGARGNQAEAAASKRSKIIAQITSLTEAVRFLYQALIDIDAHPSRLDETFSEYNRYDIDYADVRGQAWPSGHSPSPQLEVTIF